MTKRACYLKAGDAVLMSDPEFGEVCHVLDEDAHPYDDMNVRNVVEARIRASGCYLAWRQDELVRIAEIHPESEFRRNKAIRYWKPLYPGTFIPNDPSD